MAIRQAANAPVMVLTGGPGCGKTFVTATIVKLWRAMKGGYKVALCTPTGELPVKLGSDCLSLADHLMRSWTEHIVSHSLRRPCSRASGIDNWL